MSDTESLRRAAARAARARAILEDELVAEALAALERRAHDAWAASAPEDLQSRELAYRALRATMEFRAEFAKAVADGQLAERELRGRS